jgi:hypothetical protein
MMTLSTLPAELLNHITKYFVAPKLGFEDSGICNLRLTCRTIYLNTQYEFARAAFSTLWLNLQPETLKWLLTVSKRPAYGEAVKKIVVAHWGSDFIPFPDIDDDEEFGNLEEQVLFVLRTVLVDAFRAMPNLKEIVIIAPCVARFLQCRHLEQPTPSPASENVIEGRPHTHTHDELKIQQFSIPADFLFTLLMQSAFVANARISTFSITRIWTRHQLNYYPVFAISERALAASSAALAHIENLTLNIDVGVVGTEIKVPPPRDYCHSLGSTLRTLPNLKRLDIQFAGQDHYRIHRNSIIYQAMDTLQFVHLPHLTSLGLSSTTVDANVLRTFLYNHRTSLQSLTLYRVAIVGGTWHPICTMLSNEATALNELLWYEFHLVGRREVVEGLEEMKKQATLRDIHS